MKTLVVGLGNPILTDDGVGVKIAYEVEKALVNLEREDITVVEASVGGLRLMELTIGFDKVILIDSILGQNGTTPGTIKKMALDDLREISPTQHSASAHDTSFVTALDAGRTMGFHLPQDISIYAIEVENVMDFSDEPTPTVKAVIPDVTSMVLEELRIRRF